MSHDRIEIYTQPEEQNQSEDLDSSIKDKLETLIQNHPVLDEENLPDSTEKKEMKISEYKKAKEFKDTASGSSSEEEDENLDFDGMEIPQGMIPLDSQFSTQELQKIVQVAKEQNILKEEVELKIVEQGKLGDRIRVADKQ